MPREVRKRGKKHKKSQHQVLPEPPGDLETSHSSGPSWIVPAHKTEGTHSEAPFGYVDPDVKAYFRTVDEQIQSWQEDEAQPEEEGFDPNEVKHTFFVAALSEMSGKEKQLATDPDCSVVLERMVYSMDDFVLRVLVDSLSGSFEALFKHRFASHVCQTLLSVAANTVSREAKGIFPGVPTSEDNGELRTLTQLVLDICDEVGPSFNSLVMNPFASHVLRSLLLLLCPNLLPEDAARKSVRSKKSTSWKAKRGHMTSVFSDDGPRRAHVPSGLVPGSFRDAAHRLLRIFRSELEANEVRALAVHKVASPVLQLLLEIEADHGSAASSDSLMDHILVGMIKAYRENSGALTEPSDYLVALLRDPTSSHLLESLVSRCPGEVFNLLWSTYFEGKLARLAVHPVANYVLAKAIERQDDKQLGNTIGELNGSWTKLIKSSRVGVLRALVDRSRALGTHQEDVCKAVLAAVQLGPPDNKINLVPCMLFLKTFEEYQALPVPEVHRKGRCETGEVNDQREPKVQGALVLQSLMRLDEPHCSVVVDSISSLSMEDLICMAHSATGSRVLDALFESPTVSFKAKRQFVVSLIGHYHSLADDRIGSRVADRCWAFADPYLREKIARSLIPLEQLLSASFYGKFFARGLNLYLLQRRPEEWRTLQSNSKANPTKSGQQSSGPPVQQPTSPVVLTRSPKPLENRGASKDEIDAVFRAMLGDKTKKGAMDRISTHEAPRPTDRQMLEVLGAIRQAPSVERPGRIKRRKVGR